MQNSFMMHCCIPQQAHTHTHNMAALTLSRNKFLKASTASFLLVKMYSFLPGGDPESLSESLNDTPQFATTQYLHRMGTKPSPHSHY